MSNYSEEIWTLITRVLSGEATPSEQKKLQKWVREDLKHKEFFENIQSSWNQEPEQPFNTFFFDYESGLKKFRGKLNQSQQGQEDNAKSISKTLPVRKKSVLERYSWAIAAVILIAASVSMFFVMHLGEGERVMETYATSGVEQRIITLSDGSVVRLNRDSKIDVHVNKNTDIREVYLQGEAFFDVVKDPKRPFVIQTDEAAIEVLGTSFNVKEAKGVLVAVKEGVVSLRNRDYNEKSAAKVVAGQLGVLSENGQEVKIEYIDIENYFSWMNGYLEFESMPFRQVVLQLERLYGPEHVLEATDIGSIQLSVYTEQMQKEEVLNAIALALDLTYVEKGGVIYWQREK